MTMVKLFNCFKIYFSSKRINPMFHVEHFMKYFILALFIALLQSCTVRDPNPELRDVVYIDLAKELDLTKKSVEQTEKELEDREVLLRKVIPQSGQLKSLEKKVFESKNYIQKLKQQQQFFEIKLELRKNLVASKYHDSLAGGPAWPDVHEVEIYKSSLKLNRDKLGYEKNKGVVKNVPRGTTDKLPATVPAKEED